MNIEVKMCIFGKDLAEIIWKLFGISIIADRWL